MNPLLRPASRVFDALGGFAAALFAVALTAAHNRFTPAKSWGPTHSLSG